MNLEKLNTKEYCKACNSVAVIKKGHFLSVAGYQMTIMTLVSVCLFLILEIVHLKLK